MASFNLVERVNDQISEETAGKMVQVEVADTGALIMVNGKPIMVIDIDTIDDGIKLNITVHDKADRACMLRHCTVDVKMREGFECSAPDFFNENQGCTSIFTGFGTPDAAAKEFQKEIYDRFNYTLDLNKIVVKELTVDY